MSLMFSLKVGGHNKMFSFSDSYRPLKEEYEFKRVSHSLICSDEFRKKIARNKLLTGEEYHIIREDDSEIFINSNDFSSKLIRK